MSAARKVPAWRRSPRLVDYGEAYRCAAFWRGAGLDPVTVGRALGIRCRSWSDVIEAVARTSREWAER